MVVVPGLVKQCFNQRSSILTSDDFIHFILERFFGDGGATAAMNPDDVHHVHKILNTLLREPVLSNATASVVRQLECRTPSMLSSKTRQNPPQWQQAAEVTYLKNDEFEVNLYEFTTNFVGDVAGLVLMGHAFVDNNPGIIDDLWAFDDSFQALLTGIPGILGTAKARAARARLHFAISQWSSALQTTLDGKDPEISWGNMEDVADTMRLRQRAMSERDVEIGGKFNIVAHLAIYWALMINANKVIFWMLLRVVSNPALLAAIRAEVAPFVAAGADPDQPEGMLKLDVDGLIKSCPLLKATFLETMRVYTPGISYKKVKQDIVLTETPEDIRLLGKDRSQSYSIAKGTFLAIPHGTMQADPRLWKSPERFDPTRFLTVNDKEKEETAVESWRPGVRADPRYLNPWGGGTTMCKGRFFAEREVLSVVSALVAIWDFKPVAGHWTLPGMRFNGAGTVLPKKTVRVRISKRKMR